MYTALLPTYETGAGYRKRKKIVYYSLKFSSLWSFKENNGKLQEGENAK